MKPARSTSPTMTARGRKATMKRAVSMEISVRVIDGMLHAVCDVSSRINLPPCSWMAVSFGSIALAMFGAILKSFFHGWPV